MQLLHLLDSNYGGGFVPFYNNIGRVSNCGIENIKLVSVFDKTNLKDEDHRWNAINIENAEDCWVRQINFENFAGSAVSVLEASKRITVEDCISKNPVSEFGGQRRYAFLTTGQQTLFQRCYAENGYHDFAVGFCGPGPNAFVQCESIQPYSFSGAIDSWASGVLFDVVNVDGNALRYATVDRMLTVPVGRQLTVCSGIAQQHELIVTNHPLHKTGPLAVGVSSRVMVIGMNQTILLPQEVYFTSNSVDRIVMARLRAVPHMPGSHVLQDRREFLGATEVLNHQD